MNVLLDNLLNYRKIQEPSSQRLTWSKAPLFVLVIKKICDEQVIPPFIQLVSWLCEEKKMVVYIESKVLDDDYLIKNPSFTGPLKAQLKTFKEGVDDLTDKIDLIICLGGDGTLLYASSLFQDSVPPVMAFHLGSLGFLSPFKFPNFKENVTNVLNGDIPLILRTRLKCVICENDCDSGCDNPHKKAERGQHMMVLNEVVVDRGPTPYLSNLDLYIEHRYITSVQGDGLIISTTTGSTAYAAAAGASMIHPNVPAILLAPICPHSLSFRPIVVPAGVEVKIKLSPTARGEAWVSFDGRNRRSLGQGDVLRISTSIYPVPSICCEDQISDWFESLAGCLHWNVRKQQTGFNTSKSTDSFLSDSDNSSR